MLSTPGAVSGDKILPLKVDRATSADIDSQQDFERAEKLLETVDCIKPDGLPDQVG